jgi:osmoprotectant transport system ATP-binding protein
MLELSGLEKSYEGRRVLGPVDLVVPTGRTMVLIGPSGSGKSTLLRLMIGLVRPERGEVRFERERLSDETVLTMRRRMGYVIQEGGLFPHLTASGNAALMAGWLGWTHERIRARLAELAELTQYPADALGRYPVQLSGGQRQRVSLMRALMLDPDVLLLDEPLGALDPMIRSDLQSDLRRIFRALGKTVVLVTHDLAEAAYLGDEIVLMREGAILQRGTLQDFLHRPVDEFVTRFVRAQRVSIGSPEQGTA